jgi:hypothetical protein
MRIAHNLAGRNRERLAGFEPDGYTTLKFAGPYLRTGKINQHSERPLHPFRCGTRAADILSMFVL